MGQLFNSRPLTRIILKPQRSRHRRIRLSANAEAQGLRNNKVQVQDKMIDQ